LDKIASNNSDDDDDRLGKEQEETLEGHALQFMLSLLDYVFSDNEHTSALINSIAVLG
jgi:hypothetical protein